MRRFAQYGGSRMSFVMTPYLVLDIRNAAKTLMTQIHIGREFVEDPGGVPRLGPAVPQWFGETIGFWDGEALITWTSNVQGWINHGGAEFSNKLQNDRDLHTPQGRAGKLIGIKHETVLYDEESLVDPVRIVQRYNRLGALNENNPFVYDGVRAADLPDQRHRDSGDARHDVPVRVPRHVRPAVGPGLGEVPRGRHAAARGRGHLQLRVTAIET